MCFFFKQNYKNNLDNTKSFYKTFLRKEYYRIIRLKCICLSKINTRFPIK